MAITPERGYRVRREKAVVHNEGKPARELVRHPVAIEAVAEATKLLKPSGQRVA